MVKGLFHSGYFFPRWLAIMKLSLRKAFTAHARYMIMATFTTSNTWTCNPRTDTILQAWLRYSALTGPTVMCRARIKSSPMETA